MQIAHGEIAHGQIDQGKINQAPRRRYGFGALRLAVVAAFAALAAFGPARAEEDPLRDATQIVEKSTVTAKALTSDPELSEMGAYLDRARAVLIFPQVIKAGFILGGEGGTGVLLVRGADGTWSPPAFYTLAGGSIGLQLGGQVSEIIMTIMNDGALDAVMQQNFKFGGDIGVAVGGIGKGLEASTTGNFEEDIYAFSKAVGAYGGGTLEGAYLAERESLNTAFYNAPDVTVRQIVIDRNFYNTLADPLRAALPVR
jgi:lipid-binding SYLF domain-containing protein